MMRNIYDVRKEKQLQFIFSTEHSQFVPSQDLLRSCAIVVNLYYTEKVKWYSTYLNRIPEEITLYIFSSKAETLEQAEKYCNHKNTFLIKKENRGRDISAFLVAFQPYINQYEYICFIHDKKERNPWLKKDTAIWNKNLWGNMIATKDYIYNVLHLFETHPQLGMVFPPEPIGEYFTAWFYAPWMDNLQNCLELAKRLHLSADISEARPSISHGSVFWTRREAISKLFNINWKYEDFPEEPMPLDFTISHAIERIFGFVAQDAGHDVGTVMTEQYASWLLLFLQDYFRQMFLEVSDRMGADNLGQFRVLSMQKERIFHYVRAHREVFLYGAGRCGESLLQMLQEEGMEPAGFLVTDKKQNPEFIKGLKVYEFKDLDVGTAGIILTVYYPLQEEMLQELERNGIHDFMILYEE